MSISEISEIFVSSLNFIFGFFVVICYFGLGFRKNTENTNIYTFIDLDYEIQNFIFTSIIAKRMVKKKEVESDLIIQVSKSINLGVFLVFFSTFIQ